MSDITVLEAKRRRLRFNQWEVARKSGIVQSRLSLIERGEAYLKEEEARRIANALEVPFDSIFSSVTGQSGKYYAHPIRI